MYWLKFTCDNFEPNVLIVGSNAHLALSRPRNINWNPQSSPLPLIPTPCIQHAKAMFRPMALRSDQHKIYLFPSIPQNTNPNYIVNIANRFNISKFNTEDFLWNYVWSFDSYYFYKPLHLSAE